ncbi:MAG: tetratricopeptide repeat protein [Bacteroidales bacterium]|nr:tetratricopeptide repeat protein [Bacteroidales bacterium]MDY6348250.1 tetratricopeptide repeat protein [Bacteroidales bacterium]
MKRIFFALALLLATLGNVAAQQSQEEQLALQYYKEKEYDKAVELFEKIHAKKSNSYVYYYYYQALLELERYDAAEKMLKKQVKAYPNVQRYKVDLAYVYERSGDNQKAEKNYLECIKNLQAKETAVSELCNAFMARAKYDYAAETILKGRKMLDNEQYMSKNLINLYKIRHNNDKIIEEIISLVKTDNEKYQQEVQTAIQDLLVDDEDNFQYMSIRTALQKFSQKNPSNILCIKQLYWISQLHKDYPEALVLAKALDKRLKMEGIYTYEIAAVAADNRDYETAVEALNYIIKKGEDTHNYVQAKMKILDVKYMQLTSTSPVKMVDALNLEQDFRKAIEENGIHSSTMDWIRKYAHLLAFYVNKPQDAIDILEKAMAATRDVKEKNQYKIDLADVQLYTGEIWDASLNYSQVEKDLPNDILGSEAKFKNAKLSFYIGEFNWAKTQLDVLAAATSKLIANDAIYSSMLISDNLEEGEDEADTTMALFQNSEGNLALKKYAQAEFLIFQNKDDEALRCLDSVTILSPFGSLVDDALYQKALLLIKQKKFLEAEGILKKIVENYGDQLLADDAVFKLAELYEYHLKDFSQAMDYYQKILKEYSDSLYVVQARTRYRTLRGDNVN